jgi:hypothetical protein
MVDRNTLRIRALLPPLANLAKVMERDDAVVVADSIISLRRCELGICHRCASDRLTKIYDLWTAMTEYECSGCRSTTPSCSTSSTVKWTDGLGEPTSSKGKEQLNPILGEANGRRENISDNFALSERQEHLGQNCPK